MSRILIGVVIKHLGTHQRRILESMQPVKVNTMFHIDARFSTGRSTTVNAVEQLPDLCLGLNGIFELAASKLKLITKIWQSSAFDDDI